MLHYLLSFSVSTSLVIMGFFCIFSTESFIFICFFDAINFFCILGYTHYFSSTLYLCEAADSSTTFIFEHPNCKIFVCGCFISY